MRPFLTFSLALSVPALFGQTTHTIVTTGMSFSPTVLEAEVGDLIELSIGGTHTFTEVDEATWNANGSASNGGYNYGAGEHTFTVEEPGTIFYVCVPHVGMGMKGRINVSGTSTGMADTPGTAGRPLLFPNPASTSVRLTGSILPGQRAEVLNIQGQVVLTALLGTDATLDVSALPTGHYTVRMQDLQGTPVLLERLSIAR